MREGIINHYGIKFSVKSCRFHISADDVDRCIRKLFRCAFYHFRGNVNRSDMVNTALEIIGKQNARAASNVQHIDSRTNSAVIQNFSNDFLFANQTGIPFRRASIKESYNLFLIHLSLFLG